MQRHHNRADDNQCRDLPQTTNHCIGPQRRIKTHLQDRSSSPLNSSYCSSRFQLKLNQNPSFEREKDEKSNNYLYSSRSWPFEDLVFSLHQVKSSDWKWKLTFLFIAQVSSCHASQFRTTSKLPTQCSTWLTRFTRVNSNPKFKPIP